MNYRNDTHALQVLQQSHNGQSRSNNFSTNDLNRSTAMNSTRNDNNGRTTSNTTQTDMLVDGGARGGNTREKYNDMEDEDVDSLSDISTEKSDLNSSRGEYTNNRFTKVKNGTNTAPNPVNANINNSFTNNIIQKKRSRGQPIINNGSIGPTTSSSQLGGVMNMSSSVQNNDTDSINMESTNTSHMDENDDLKMKTKNREHAKKTRIRKKNYIESLKETVKLFSEEREKADRDTRNALTKLAEQSRVRKQVLQTMFYFRSINETDHSKWATILDENFSLILPITPYRSFSPSQVANGQRAVAGIDGMVKDTASLYVLVQSIGQAKDDGCFVRIQYYSELDDGIFNNDSFMCRWLMKTENAVERGARQEVYKHGMVEAVFSSQNKLVRLEMAFDVMSFMQQLRRASGRYDFQLIPNTVALASVDDSSDSRIIVKAIPPYLITNVNQNWCNMSGYKSSQAINKPFSLFKGFETEIKHYNHLMKCFANGESGCVRMTSYSSNTSKIRIFVKVFPLFTNLFVTHFLVVFEHAFDFPSIVDSFASVQNNLFNAVPRAQADNLGSVGSFNIPIQTAISTQFTNNGMSSISSSSAVSAKQPFQKTQQFPTIANNTAAAAVANTNTNSLTAFAYHDGNTNVGIVPVASTQNLALLSAQSHYLNAPSTHINNNNNLSSSQYLNTTQLMQQQPSYHQSTTAAYNSNQLFKNNYKINSSGKSDSISVDDYLGSVGGAFSEMNGNNNSSSNLGSADASDIQLMNTLNDPSDIFHMRNSSVSNSISGSVKNSSDDSDEAPRYEDANNMTSADLNNIRNHNNNNSNHNNIHQGLGSSSSSGSGSGSDDNRVSTNNKLTNNDSDSGVTTGTSNSSSEHPSNSIQRTTSCSSRTNDMSTNNPCDSHLNSLNSGHDETRHNHRHDFDQSISACNQNQSQSQLTQNNHINNLHQQLHDMSGMTHTHAHTRYQNMEVTTGNHSAAAAAMYGNNVYNSSAMTMTDNSSGDEGTDQPAMHMQSNNFNNGYNMTIDNDSSVQYPNRPRPHHHHHRTTNNSSDRSGGSGGSQEYNQGGGSGGESDNHTSNESGVQQIVRANKIANTATATTHKQKHNSLQDALAMIVPNDRSTEQQHQHQHQHQQHHAKTMSNMNDTMNMNANNMTHTHPHQGSSLYCNNGIVNKGNNDLTAFDWTDFLEEDMYYSNNIPSNIVSSSGAAGGSLSMNVMGPAWSVTQWRAPRLCSTYPASV